MTVRVLILPGLFNSGAEHWQSHWEQRYSGLHRVKQEDWQNPVCTDWVQNLQKKSPRASALWCWLAIVWRVR